MEKIRGLYKITNEYSGLFYIGKSVDIYKRWITHKKDFENGTHSGGAFQYDYDVGGTFTYNKKRNFYFWLQSICDDIWMLIRKTFDRNVINVYPLELLKCVNEDEIEFVTRYSNIFTPFFSMFTSNDVWIRYDKKRMIVSILDKSIIPDIVTPDDIFYHTESLI